MVACIAGVLLTLGSTTSAFPSPVPRADGTAEPDTATAAGNVPPQRRAEILGPKWRTSSDRAWIVSGDGDGLHLLVADAAHAYGWRPLATLSEPNLESDKWIGNACVTGSGRKAVVVYAPRTFTNESTLFDRGGFTAVVDLRTGAVEKLPVLSSLAYFNPSCGPDDEALVTQAGEEDLGRTRLIRVDTASARPRLRAKIEVPGQLTSAVPTSGGGIVAADSGGLVRVDAKGVRRVLAPATGVPFKLAADRDGGVVFMERLGADRVAVRRATVAGASGTETRAAGSRLTTLATGSLMGLDVTSGRGGRVFVTGAGRAKTVAEAPSVSVVDVSAGARLSTDGRLAVTSVLAARPGASGRVADPAAPQPLTIAAKALSTGKTVSFSASPATSASGERGSGRAPSPAATTGRRAASRIAAGAAADPNDPADLSDRYCAVPRNDPRNQAMQPKPRQVEWAVDQAVRETLTVSRPANWKNLNMPAYTPQGLFRSLGLTGGGYVPAQIMLGIAAQESNLWQAARFAVPGVTANPLIGNYYGLDIYNDTSADDWTIHWDKADCGYGVTQVTDHMRLAGKEKGPEDTAWAYQTQRAVGLDFAANIAAGLQILQTKWNQVKSAGLTINNGDPAKIENWFYAVWAYNSGFYPSSQAGQNNGAWGLGWSNNPVNPKYPANRDPFLEFTYEDAAHPQHWPYPEKVMGWAGHPVEVLESPNTLVAGYRPAWWNGDAVTGPLNRQRVKPPPTQFCDASNQCVPGGKFIPDDPDVIGEPAGPCSHKNSAGKYDLKCWYHQSSTWKSDCDYSCGNELLRFDPGYAYQDDGTAYPPRCTLDGLASNASIVDDVPDGTPSIRPGCGRPWTNAGTFTFSFAQDGTGQYPGKIDTHQIGGGFGGHFWFTHTRTASSEGGRLEVNGTWRLGRSYTGLMRVLVALPDHGAHTNQARYVIKTARGDRVSVVKQPGSGNRWVSLGTFRFDGVPEVRLSSVTPDGDGTQDVAFDAMAFVPVTQAPALRVLHWNMDGAKDNLGEYDVVERLIREVQARNPDVISLNEICQRQFEHLGVRLEEIGYKMGGYYRASQLIVPSCQVGSDSRTSAGNAVLARADIESPKGYVFDSDNKLVDRPPIPLVEDRSVACVTARFPSVDQPVKLCSTHLAERDKSDPPPPNPLAAAEAQTRELARVFGPQAQTMPLILAGDFNIPVTPEKPANGALGALYGAPAGTGDFLEVDQERACGSGGTCVPTQGGTSTHRSDQKIDYVFASNWHFFLPPNPVQIITDVGTCGSDNHACSDHYIFRSELQIPRQ